MDKIIKFLAYLIVLFFIFVLIDIFYFNKVLGLGNLRYKTNLNDVSTKVEHPYVGFIEKGIASSEPYSVYYTGEKIYLNNEGKIKIAFFGGSTSAYHDPEKEDSLPIPKYLEKILKERLSKDVVVVNYACGGAHHRQHLHMLLEFLPKFKPDIVVFYGGNNEIMQTYGDDPRPNYPFNYFYKSEFPTWKKFLMEYSAIIGALNEKLNFWSEEDVRNRINFRSKQWEEHLIKNYFETLDLSNTIVSSFSSDLFGKCKFVSIFQPINVDYYLETDVEKQIAAEQDAIITYIRGELPKLSYSYDFYHKYDHFSEEVWYDICHVRDEANQYMAKEIADLLIDKYLKKYEK